MGIGYLKQWASCDIFLELGWGRVGVKNRITSVYCGALEEVAQTPISRLCDIDQVV